jgi:hypothetical protein
MMRPRLLTVCAALALAAGCETDDAPTDGRTVEVIIDQFTFTPAT